MPPPAPPARNAVTGTCDQPGALRTRAAPASVTPGHGLPATRSLLPRRAAHAARAALPAGARSTGTGTAHAAIRGARRRLAGLLRLADQPGWSYYDAKFERPDLVEGDYYRFWNQPRGW